LETFVALLGLLLTGFKLAANEELPCMVKLDLRVYSPRIFQWDKNRQEEEPSKADRKASRPVSPPLFELRSWFVLK